MNIIYIAFYRTRTLFGNGTYTYGRILQVAHQPAGQPTSLVEGFWADHLQGRCSGVQISAWSGANVGLPVTNYVDRQTLKPEDDYVLLPHQRLWTFDVLVCPLSATERFLLQPLVCGTVFHRTSLLAPRSTQPSIPSG